MTYLYYLISFNLFISLLISMYLRKVLHEIREVKNKKFDIQISQGEPIIKEVEVIKYLPAIETPKDQKQIRPKEMIDVLLKSLEEDGINHIEVDITNNVSFDESHKYLKMLTAKRITMEQYERLKNGMERRYYFSYDDTPTMFEQFLKSKENSKTVYRYNMNGRKVTDGFISNTFFINKEKLEKEFQNEPKNQEGLFAMKDAYINIVKKGVGNKLTDQMNL